MPHSVKQAAAHIGMYNHLPEWRVAFLIYLPVVRAMD